MGDSYESKKKRIAELRSSRAKAQQVKDEQILQPITTNGNSKMSLSSNEIEQILLDCGIPAAPDVEKIVDKTLLKDSMTESSILSNMASQMMTSSKLVSLEIGSASTTAVPGRVSSAYTKGTQTDEERVTNSVGEFSLGSQEFDYDDELLNLDHFRGRAHSHDLESPIHMTEDIAKLLPGFNKYAEPVEKTQQAAQEAQKIEALTEDDKRKVLLSDGFQNFVARDFRLMEKVLASADDDERFIFTDYTRDDKENVAKSSELLQLSHIHKSEEWAANRWVTGIDFSKLNSELMAVAYDENKQELFDYVGVVLIWNLKVKTDTPEFVFHCSDRVTSVTFAHFHKHLIFAGCHSGQISVWDNRILRSRIPISVTTLSPTSHTRPVCALNVVGNRNACNLMSLCRDGRIASWILDNISQPVQTKDLQCSAGKAILAVCMALPANETDNVLVGTQTGEIFEFALAATGNASPTAVNTYSGHSLTVSSISFHKAIGVIDFSHLFLSAAIDGQIRLWSTKDPKLSMRFESHYVMVKDVAWSPVHPAVFISIDTAGWIFLWNLNEDTESPVVKIRVTETTSLSKLKWNNEGSQVCVGDGAGNVYNYTLHERMYVINSEEWTHLSRVLADQKRASEDADTMAEMMSRSTTSRLFN